MLLARILLLALLFSISNYTLAVDKFWRPAGGNLNWSTAANWIPLGVPTSGDVAFI